MSQEEVTKNAPDWMKESGIAEYRKQTDESEKVEQVNQENQEATQEVEDAAQELNINLDQFRDNAETVLARQDPNRPTGFEDDYAFEKKEYDQGFWADAGAGLWNGLVVGGLEGLVNFNPTVIQALGVESEFVDTFSEGVTEFFDNQRMIYSDAADDEISEFGDINLSHVGRALGQGVGFLVGIIGTGGGSAAASLGRKTIKKAAKIQKGLMAAEKAATGAAKIAAAAKLAKFQSRSANIIAKANKGEQMASRIGTFMAGTTLMYPEIQKEAKKAGLSTGAAARFSLGVSGLVSFTEGAALEWIGKIATKPLTQAITNANVKTALRSGATNPQELLKIFMTGYSKDVATGALSKGAIMSKLGVIAQGSAIEFGQEFSQTYIEEGAKQLYDTVYKDEGKGEFGADVTTYKSFVESTFGGLIGAVLGGGMAFMQSGQGLGDSLTKEGLFGYINNAVEQGKKSKITDLKDSINLLVENKKMSKTEAAESLKLIDELNVFAENVKTSDINDGVAKYQLFQLDRASRNADTVSEKINPDNTSNPKLKEEANKKKAMLAKVKAKIDANFSTIYDSKTSEKSPDSSKTSYQKKGLADGTVSAEGDTKVENDTQDQVTEEQETKEEVTIPSNKVAFDTKIQMYEQLIVDIAEGKVSEEQLPDMLSRIDSSQAIGTTTGSDVVINGVNIPIAIAEDTDAVNDIKNSFDLVDSGKLSSEDFYKQIQEKYNLTEDQTNQIINEDFVKNYEEIKNKKDGKDKTKDKDKKDDTKKDKKVLLETTEQKEERLGKLTQREQEIQDEIDSLEEDKTEKPEELVKLEEELADMESKPSNDLFSKENIEAQKEKIKQFKKNNPKFRQQESKNKRKAELINELNKVVSEREVVDQEIKKTKLEEKKKKEEEAKAKKEEEEAKKNEDNEWVKTQRDALGFLKNRGDRLRQERLFEAKEKETKAEEKARKQRLEDKIAENEKEVARIEKEIKDFTAKSKAIKKKAEVKKEKVKQKFDDSAKIETQVGKKVKWKGKEYTIAKEGVRYVLENDSSIIELDATDASTLSELNLVPVVAKTKGKFSSAKYTNATEEGITIDGKDYVYKLDKNGNVIALVPVGKGSRITNENALINAEIERNKLDNKSHTEEEIDNFDESIEEGSAEDKAYDIVLDKYTDNVDTALSKLDSDVPLGMFGLTNQERKEVNEWVDNALAKVLEAYDENPSSELEEWNKTLESIKIKLNEEAEKQTAKKDSPNSKKKGKRKTRAKQKRTKLTQNLQAKLESQTSLNEEIEALDRTEELEQQALQKENEIKDNVNQIEIIEDINNNDDSYENIINKAVSSSEKNQNKPTREAAEKETGNKVGRNQDISPTKVSKEGKSDLTDLANDLISGKSDTNSRLDAETMFQYLIDFLQEPGGIVQWREVVFRKQELKQREADLKKQEQEYEAINAELNKLKAKFPDSVGTPVQTSQEQEVEQQEVQEDSVKEDEFFNQKAEEELEARADLEFQESKESSLDEILEEGDSSTESNEESFFGKLNNRTGTEESNVNQEQSFEEENPLDIEESFGSDVLSGKPLQEGESNVEFEKVYVETRQMEPSTEVAYDEYQDNVYPVTGQEYKEYLEDYKKRRKAYEDSLGLSEENPFENPFDRESESLRRAEDGNEVDGATASRAEEDAREKAYNDERASEEYEAKKDFGYYQKKKFTNSDFDLLRIYAKTRKDVNGIIFQLKNWALKKPIQNGDTTITHIIPDPASGTFDVIFDRKKSGNWKAKFRLKNGKLKLDLYTNQGTKGAESFVSPGKWSQDFMDKSIAAAIPSDLISSIENDLRSVPQQTDTKMNPTDFSYTESIDKKYGISKTLGDIINELKGTTTTENTKPKFQKKKFTNNEKANETIAENPGLFFFVKNALKKMFPNISVEMVDSMLAKYGVDALGSAFKNVVNIQRDSAQQTTILHEFAHIYVDMLGRNHPLVKMGLDLVRDTELHERAKKEYPELSEQDQLMEALVESIAIKGLGQLRTSFEGTTLEKIQAWLKRFWNRIKGLANSKAYNEIDAITRQMLRGGVKNKNGLSSRVKFQKSISNAYAEAVNITTNAVAKLRMAAVRDPRIKFNDLDTVKAEIYANLWTRYEQEKDIDQVTTNPIFQKIDLEEPSPMNLYKAIQKEDKKLFDFIENTSKNVSDVSRFEIEEKADQVNEGLTKPDSDSAIKASKGFSPSVKSVLSSMVDNEGNSIDVNEVFRYVASIASNSINDQDFLRRVKERRDRNSNNIISDRVYNILESMPAQDKQLLIFEMASAVQTPFKKFAFLENFRKEEGNKNKLVIRQLNKNYEAGIAASGMLANIKSFTDQDALDAKEEIFGGNRLYASQSFARLISPSGYFGLKFQKNRIITEKLKKEYNQVVSAIVGEEVPRTYTDKLTAEKPSPTATTNITPAQNFLSRIYSKTNTTEDGRPPEFFEKASIDSYLEKIAKEIDGTDSLTNSFINSSGQNVSSTALGHSMIDTMNRYRDDVANPQRLSEAKEQVKKLKDTNGTDAQIQDAQSLVDDITEAIETKEQYKKSPIYEKNTILNRADKDGNNGVIEHFTADAIDANGKVRELSGQTKDDIMITQLMGFANDTDRQSYSQQYGIQGDRPRTRFFKAPRFKGASLKQAYQELKEIDEYLYKEFKEKAEKKHGVDTRQYDKAFNRYRQTYNKSSLNYMNQDGSIVIPQESKKRQSDINRAKGNLKTALRTAGLTSQVKTENGEEIITPSIIGADHIGEGKLYKNENDLIETFIYNEALNRTHLNNLFQGPIAHRKSVEDHIKRALGTDSTGNKVHIDKPVVTVVIKADGVLKDNNGKPIPTSDSFSINGERLHSHIAKKVGGMDRLGSNMKDILFQVDPYSGNMTFLKMSSMGVIGDQAFNNFNEMSAPKYAKDKVGYAQLAQVAFALEEAVGEGKYIKIVDENAIKGNEGKDVVPIDIDALLTTDPKSIIENNSFELNYTGYRTPFKLNKSLTKVELKDQTVVGSSQLMKIAGNTGHPKQIIEFEIKLVNLLKDQLGIEKGKSYRDSKLYKMLANTDNILNGVLKGAEESGKQSIANVLNAVNQHNKAIEEKARPLKQKIVSAKENNPVISERSNELVKEIQENQAKVNEILKEKITALDHPNTKAQIEQYMGSRMGRQGARPEMPGAYLHMIPDYGRTLKPPKKQKVAIKNKTKFKKKIAINKTKLARLKENNAKPELIKKQSDYLKKLEQERKDGIREILTDFEVATPWSMWGKTREEAEAFIKARKESGVPVKVVVVRVPASIGVSTFAADVAYLTDGEANTVITPDEFIKMSDADHDADKAFVYREEIETKKEKVKDKKGKEVLDEEGNPTTRQFTKEVMGGRSDKSKLFWNLYTQISSDEIREQHKEDLTTDRIKEIVEDIEKKQGETKSDYNLNTFEDLADVLSKYSFGARAIGIEAVAGKMLSMFTQSEVKLTKKGEIVFNGKIYDKFVDDNAIELAKVLQAALDLGNDPILLRTGINKHTIGTANVMLSLGVPLEEVIETLKSEAIVDLVNLVDKNTSVFAPATVTFEDALANKKLELAGIETLNISQTQFNDKKKSIKRLEAVLRDKKTNKPFKLKEGVNYQTRASKDGLTQAITFTVKNNEIVESSPEIKNEEAKKQYALMESFVDFSNLSDEINQILPVIQRDNKMPNNSTELRSTKKAFDKLRKGLLVDFTPILERPLTGHYEQIVDLMIELEEKHFATEKGSYSQSDNNTIDQIESAINPYGTKSAKRGMVVDVYQRMIAQGITKVAKPTKFVTELPNQLESLLSYQNKQEFVSNFNNLFNEKTGKDSDIDVFIEAIIAKEESGADVNSMEYQESIDTMLASLDTQQEMDLALDFLQQARDQIASFTSPELKENLFLKHIQVKQAVTGSNVKTIVPIDNYRKVSVEVKEQIRNDFKKIYNTSLGQSIYKYQMLRNGVSDKIGSLIDLMPEEISVNFLKKMTAIKDSDAIQPRFPQAYEYNALLSLKESLQPVRIVPNQGYLTKGWAVENGEIVKIPQQQGKGLVALNSKIPKIRSYTFVKNDDYKFIKFDPNATIKETSYQEIEQTKEQCNINLRIV